MVDVIWLSYKKEIPPTGYWDHGFLHDLFDRKLWNPIGASQFEHHNSWPERELGGAVIVFPARSQGDCIDQLNKDLARLKWVVLILTGDEANEFPFEKVKHPNMKLWIMSPRPSRHGSEVRKIGSGFPPVTRGLLTQFWPESKTRMNDWFFAGQITHERRLKAAVQMKTMLERTDIRGEYIPTEGFTQGVPHEWYFRKMANSKVVICPSGPETPESFRVFEALESGCIPIVDTRTPKGEFPDDFWIYFFGEEPPFPVYTNPEQIPGYTLAALEEYPRLANKVFAWWQGYKRHMAYWLEEDIELLSGHKNPANKAKDVITVIIPSSPIPAHPDTAMIEQTIKDIRTQLPFCEIIITLDGVRDEQKHRVAAYEEYKQRLLWKCNFEWDNVLPVIFEKHMHQANMAREVLKMVKTPILLYVEHDAPITPDRKFEWARLCDAILDGHANVIRFNHEASIIPEHQHLVIGQPEPMSGVFLLKTKQWSQRPHLASVAFYRHMLDTYFNPESRTMIEDVMHGIVEIDCRENGNQAWYNWRIWIYAPQGEDMKRSYHLDGRGADPKYEMDIKPVKRPKL